MTPWSLEDQVFLVFIDLDHLIVCNLCPAIELILFIFAITTLLSFIMVTSRFILNISFFGSLLLLQF